VRGVVLVLLAAQAAFAAEYRAGVARFELAPGVCVSALAIERGAKERVVVVVDAGGGLPHGVTDAAVARAELERGQVVFLPNKDASALPPAKLVEGLATAIGAAWGALAPATLWWAGQDGALVLRAEGADGAGLAALAVRGGNASLEFGSPRAGRFRSVRGPIRTAFRAVEPPVGLRTREGVAGAPGGIAFVQAVRFGRSLTLVVWGEAPGQDSAARIEREFASQGEPLAAIAGADAALPPDLHDALVPALRIVLRRVGRRF